MRNDGENFSNDWIASFWAKIVTTHDATASPSNGSFSSSKWLRDEG